MEMNSTSLEMENCQISDHFDPMQMKETILKGFLVGSQHAARSPFKLNDPCLVSITVRFTAAGQPLELQFQNQNQAFMGCWKPGCRDQRESAAESLRDVREGEQAGGQKWLDN